jgi:hypothetical protein
MIEKKNSSSRQVATVSTQKAARWGHTSERR